MLASWMIEEIERERREREAREERQRPRLWIESHDPDGPGDRIEREPSGSTVVTIDVWGEP